MIHTKRVIFMILPLLFAPLVYGLSSTPDACAAPTDPKWDTGTCYNWEYSALRTCCWQEPDILNPGETIAWCQTCNLDGTNCGAVFFRSSTGPLAPPQDGVLEEPLTPPTGPFAPPGGFGILQQQPLTTLTQPPLFGRNDATVPLQGGGVFGQPTTTTTPIPTPPPFGQIAPEGPTLAGEDGVIQPMNTTFPTPEPFPPPPTPGFPPPPVATDVSPDRAPEDDQDETDDDGGGNDIVPDTGIAEQPETQGPEGPSNEEQSTAGPLT
jgi:hypothetical protein